MRHGFKAAAHIVVPSSALKGRPAGQENVVKSDCPADGVVFIGADGRGLFLCISERSCFNGLPWFDPPHITFGPLVFVPPAAAVTLAAISPSIV